MDRKAQVEAAFLEWINSFPFPNKVASLKDLNDGMRIWDALRDIDPSYFTGDLPEGPSDTGKWPQRWQNLRHIIKSLMAYIRDKCGPALLKDPALGDLKLIALNAETGEKIIKAGLERGRYYMSDTDYTVQLLKLVLIAAINSPKATDYITKMPTLSTSTQSFLKESIEEVLSAQQHHQSPPARANSQQMQDTTNAASDSDVPSTPVTSAPPPAPVDLELFVEERLGEVVANRERLIRENQDLQKNVRDLQNRLGRLQENNAVLQHRLVQAEDTSQVNASAEATVVDSSLKALRIRIQEQEDVIATQESSISEYRTNTEALQKIVERTQVSSTKLQRLQDEIDELQVERDEYAKKANTVDKYKQKLQASQDLEKDNELLRAEIEDIRQNIRNAAEIQEQLDSVRQTADEYKEILPRIEQDRHELQMMKSQLEQDNAALAERFEEANEQHIRDQETMEELKIEIQNAEIDALPSFGVGRGLGSELAETTENESKLQVARLALIFSRYLNQSRKTQISELENEVTQLKTDFPAQIVTLQQLLDDTQRRLGQTEAELADGTQKLDESYNRRRSLEALHAKAVQEHVNQYTALRKLDGQTSEANKVLQKKSDSLEHELKVQKDLLRDAQEAEKKTPITTEPSSRFLNKTLETLDLIKSAARNRSQRPAPGSTDHLEQLMANCADEIISGADELAKRTEELENQNAVVKDLQERLKLAEAKPASHTSDQLASQQELENLKRENKLIASAFHDMAGRLQMNTVSLQRRNEPPRSWMNKMRRQLEQPAMVRSR